MNKLDKIRHAAKLVDALEDIQRKQQLLEGKKLIHITFKDFNSTKQASHFIEELMELDIHGDIRNGLNVATEIYQDYILKYMKNLEKQLKSEIDKIL